MDTCHAACQRSAPLQELYGTLVPYWAIYPNVCSVCIVYCSMYTSIIIIKETLPIKYSK